MFIGISSNILNRRFATQRDSMWCWAAALQMIFHHYGLVLPQEQIVKRTFGKTMHGFLPNKPGDFADIMKNLNNWGIDLHGKHYQVKAAIFPGAPSPLVIVDELTHQRPLLLSYQSRPRMNHAVVITGAELIEKNSALFMKTLVVRDPSPLSKNRELNGRREYKPSSLFEKSSAHWLIRIRS